MKRQIEKGKIIALMVCGILGAVLMTASDWLMIYGDIQFSGQLSWLTDGVAGIDPSRNNLAMMLAFPAVVLYAAGFLGVAKIAFDDTKMRVYSGLTIVGMTPWLCMHLFYSMIFFMYSFMTESNLKLAGLTLGEAIVDHFYWIVIVSDVFMVLPFLYLFLITVTDNTILSRGWALNNPLLIFVIMKIISDMMPQGPASLAFINGLMSESMIIWFILMITAVNTCKRKTRW